MFLRFLACIVKYVMRLFLPTKVYGNNKLDTKGCLYLGNHQSGWDSVLFYCWTRGEMPCIMYKSDFDKNWLLHWLFTSFRGIPVRRGDADLTSTKITIERLADGHDVCVFPEGTRNPAHNCLLDFRKGSALYPLKSKCPIRVFYIWERTKVFRKNRIIISEPFTLEQFYDKPVTKALLAEVTAYLQSKVDELRLQLNDILANKNIKHRKYSKKDIKRIKEFYGERAQEIIDNTFVTSNPLQQNVAVDNIE